MTKTTFKTLFLMLAIGLTSAKVMGQSPKDYYILSQSNYNKASFYLLNKTGERSDFTKVIYYVNNDDGTYDITVVSMFQGQPAAISTETVKFTTTQVIMTKSVSASVLGNNKKQSYEPARTLLKMPAAEQTATWSIPEDDGKTKTNYISSWTTVTVDGVSKKAIKVTCQWSGRNKTKHVAYYVEGIGYWKTVSIDEDGKTKPFEKFDGFSYEATTR